MRNSSQYFSNWLLQHWQRAAFVGWLLCPISLLFRFVVYIRSYIYQRFAYKSSVPVIVVGNITVGGTGKTPLVIYLVNLLQQHGYRVGIVSRGYKSFASQDGKCVRVTPDADPTIVGDEPLLLAQTTGVPVVIARRRVAAVQMLENDVDLIIADDGLQHYRMARDIEVVTIDCKTKFGNGYCLPMGPLREPISRLNTVDFILENGCDFVLAPQKDIDGTGQTVHAVTGIGNPQRFFSTLRQMGFTVIEHAFPDHFAFMREDLQFADQYPIYITAKDWVKCSNFGLDLNVIDVVVQFAPQHEFTTKFLALVKEKQHARSKLTRDPCLSNL